MRLVRLLMLIFFFGFQLSCSSQKSNDNTELSKADQILVEIYNKYSENRHDYASKPGEARDTILNRFKKTLRSTLEDPKFKAHDFEVLNKRNGISVTISPDKKLKIVSWDELNGGTWHIYNAMYRFEDKSKIYTGILNIESDGQEPLFTDITYLKIFELPNKGYLLIGYGTHGSGEDFYSVRNLHLENNELKDCSQCFDGNDILTFIKPRAHDSFPNYDTTKKIIAYPEYKEDGETGFLKLTGKTITLRYQDGTFYKTE